MKHLVNVTLKEALYLAARGVPTVGAVAIAIRQTGVCDLGELGVCYEVYQRGSKEPGYSFIFASGRYDGFSPAEVRLMLTLTGEVCPAIMNYRFRNVSVLATDFRSGRFADAFRRAPASPATKESV